MNRSSAIVSFCLLLGLAWAMPLTAQTTPPVFWNNTDATLGGDFCDPLNWDTGVFPGVLDTASLQNSNLFVTPPTDPPTTTNIWYPSYIGATAPPNAINSLYVGNTLVNIRDGVGHIIRTVPKGGGWVIQSAQTLDVNTEVVIGQGWDAWEPASWSEYEINGGILNVSPATGDGLIRVARSTNVIAIMTVKGTATVNVNPTSGLGMFIVGTVYGSTGIVRQSDSTSTVNIKSGLTLGEYDAGTTGYYSLTGGHLNINSYGQEATIGANGNGLFEMTGGNVYVASRTEMAIIHRDIYGVLNISGGTYWNNGSAQTDVGDAGTAIINVSGSGLYHAGGYMMLGRSRLGGPLPDDAHGTGIVNVGTGGTVESVGMLKGVYAKAASFNFHGGTLKTLDNSYNFFVGNHLEPSYNTTKAESYVYPEGGIIDTNGKAVMMATPLAAPTGNGLSNLSIDPTEPSWKLSYRAPPIVQISRGAGDTTGFGRDCDCRFGFGRRIDGIHYH